MKHLKALVAHTDADTRGSARTILETMGYHEIFLVTNAMAAMETIEENSDLHVILSSLDVPGANGFSLLRTARERLPKVKLILVTEDMSAGIRENAKTLGVKACFMKSEIASTLPKYINGDMAA